MNNGTRENNIRLLMSNFDVTAEQLSKDLNLSISTVNRLVSGAATDPRLSSLKPFAKYFNVSIEELIGDVPLSSGHGASRFNFLRVPLLYWEQVKNYAKEVKSRNPSNWDRWSITTEQVSTGSYALSIKQTTLPPPFYPNATIIVDPSKQPVDGDYVIINSEGNPEISRFYLKGLQKVIVSVGQYEDIVTYLDADSFESVFCGTIVQWQIKPLSQQIIESDYGIE